MTQEEEDKVNAYACAAIKRDQLLGWEATWHPSHDMTTHGTPMESNPSPSAVVGMESATHAVERQDHSTSRLVEGLEFKPCGDCESLGDCDYNEECWLENEFHRDAK